MSRWVHGSLIAPVLLGACAAATAPPANPVRDTTQFVHDASGVPEPAVDGEKLGGEVPAAPPPSAPPSSPAHALETSQPPEPYAEPFTRKVERAAIEARGAARAEAGFDDGALRAAAAFDNEAWKGDRRMELLAYLRGEMVKKHDRFTETDARLVARIQAGSGVPSNGELKDETMAVLFAMGFRFSARKAPAREVTLQFYPGDVEDLDAWNREIDEKVRKKGGSFSDVTAPQGEGTLYVYVGRSLVASYRARGGPPSRLEDDREDVEDGDNGDHAALPTKPGVYRLGPPHVHVTSSWYFSQIPWGAEIRATEAGYQYRWAGRTGWLWATPHAAGKLKRPLIARDFEGLPEVTRDGETFRIWNKNDFGPISWNLVPSDQYVHTTPEAEAARAATPATETSLAFSHGCVHIDPGERDEMVSRGYLRAGVLFIVHRWDEHLLPDEVRRDLLEPAERRGKS